MKISWSTLLCYPSSEWFRAIVFLSRWLFTIFYHYRQPSESIWRLMVASWWRFFATNTRSWSDLSSPQRSSRLCWRADFFLLYYIVAARGKKKQSCVIFFLLHPRDEMLAYVHCRFFRRIFIWRSIGFWCTRTRVWMHYLGFWKNWNNGHMLRIEW